MAREPASRLDQWLWAVRAFKTRSLAVAAIKAGQVEVDGRSVKPAHTMRPGELIQIRMGLDATPWIRSLLVLGIPLSRVGAPLVPQFAEDRTPAEELEKAKMREPVFPGWRPKGSGRPTKRDRREIDSLGIVPFDP
jgi:ribosome-associated heat shock protein Hsp15